MFLLSFYSGSILSILTAAVILTVSPADKRALSRLATQVGERIRLLPNGVDPDYWSMEADYPTPEMGHGARIVFDGTMDYRPNVDAVVWFTGEVWPLIKQASPDAHFYIVGRNPAQRVKVLGQIPGITVTGQVEDTRGWVAGADVYVVPMRMGGGVRLKVLQAMSIGCAIVSTPMGAEGIVVEGGRDMLLARSAHEFAGDTLALLADSAKGAKLGSTARELAKRKYSWEALLRTLDELYSPD